MSPRDLATKQQFESARLEEIVLQLDQMKIPYVVLDYAAVFERSAFSLTCPIDVRVALAGDQEVAWIKRERLSDTTNEIQFGKIGDEAELAFLQRSRAIMFDDAGVVKFASPEHVLWSYLTSLDIDLMLRCVDIINYSHIDWMWLHDLLRGNEKLLRCIRIARRLAGRERHCGCSVRFVRRLSAGTGKLHPFIKEKW